MLCQARNTHFQNQTCYLRKVLWPNSPERSIKKLKENRMPGEHNNSIKMHCSDSDRLSPACQYRAKSVPIDAMSSWKASCHFIELSYSLTYDFSGTLGRGRDIKSPRDHFSLLYVIVLIKSLRRKKWVWGPKQNLGK